MREKTHILVLDDETLIQDGIREHFSRLGYKVSCASTWQEAEEILSAKKIHIVILDIILPGLNRKMDGMEILKIIKQNYPEMEIVMISAHATVNRVIEAWRAGAIMFLEKPYELSDLTIAVQRAEHYSLRWQRIHQLEEESIGYAMERDLGTSVIAQSPQIKMSIKLAKQYAQNNHSVLLTGESGTGKEIIAKLIHYSSRLKARPLCAVNVNAIPSELFESTLFGYVKGAFAGADKNSDGLIDKAENGTLFLDEIGDLDPGLQSKLLRVIENREFYRVGAIKPIKTNTRFIFASMYDLSQRVESGHFRKDLYYRISELEIHISPLRERKEDILALTDHFLHQIANEEGRAEVPKLKPEATEALLNYEYAGNVRELKKIIRQAMILSDKDELDREDLFPNEPKQSIKKSKCPCADCEAHYIRQVLKNTDCNATKTMKLLGISRTAFYQKIKRYQINISTKVE